MALRFRKSIKLAPGIRWNISGSGSSWSFGPRGASVSVGKRGTFFNSGVPGTGFSSRSRLSPAAASARSDSPAATRYTMTCALHDDGTLTFTDADGSQMPEHLVELAKKQNRQAIAELIQRKCDEINEQIEALGRLHHDTPAPQPPRFTAPPFSEPCPAPPHPRRAGFFASLIPGTKRKIEAANKEAAARHRAEAAQWDMARAAYEQEVEQQRRLVEKLIYEDTAAMERYFEACLAEITWPRETQVSLEIRESGAAVALDVDLPEVEDMPTKLAAVPARGLKLSVKELSATKVQKLYAEHVHGVVFRLVGEVFAALPAARQVTVAGYSQRRDPATGQLHDDYLLSVRVDREAWSRIDFAHLPSVDAAEALSRFDLRRSMSKAGAFKAIEAHA